MELDGVVRISPPKPTPIVLFVVLAFTVDVSLREALNDGAHVSPKLCAADPLAFSYPFSAALDDVWFFNTGTTRLLASQGTLALLQPGCCCLSHDLPLVIDTAETLDLTEAVKAGRLDTGGSFFVPTFPGRDAVLIVTMDDVAGAAEAVDQRRVAVLNCFVKIKQPAVAVDVDRRQLKLPLKMLSDSG